MSLFGKILNKLGLRNEDGGDKPAATTTAGTTGSMASKPAAVAPKPTATTPSKPASGAKASPRGVATSTPGFADRRERDDVAPRREAAAVATAPKEMSRVDVINMLEQKAKGTGLNWKQSISDLLFLLDIDNSREARNELAKELGCPPELMSDSAKMNTWLHKTVLRKIAENGGNIPQELLD